MDYQKTGTNSGKLSTPVRDLARALIPYRTPNQLRSVIEVAITAIPFFVMWAICWWAYSISYWLCLALCIPTGAFLVRLFLIQHDCGHGAFFRNRQLNDWIGRILGIFTMTPYHVWKRSHALHHAGSGNLDKRGIGDISTLTVKEYMARGLWGRVTYRAYRNPITLFVIGPAYQFLLRNRLPQQYDGNSREYWISTMGTNAMIALVAGVMMYFAGFGEFLAIQIPITLVASSIGVWLFYVQHQFETTEWDYSENWEVQDAAFHGSSHYDLPAILRWASANIGVHHVHHLNSKIPFYRLPQVLKDLPELTEIRRLTLLESFRCVKLHLWDENTRRLVTFAEARTIA
ncbi:MAG: fatty acid desaturase [Rhizobiaceae bacterium]